MGQIEQAKRRTQQEHENGRVEPNAQSLVNLEPQLAHGLAVLLQAHDYAVELSRDVWDFAVELTSLREEGLTVNDFRWLACKRYVEHAREITVLGKNGREFRRGGDISFAKRSCLVLTDEGLDVARHTTAAVATTKVNGGGPPWARPALSELLLGGNGHARRRSNGPAWDCDRRELSVGSMLVKQFKLPSPNQETILIAFEEEQWPVRIDDPLPPQSGLDPKRRLHDSIKSLNRHQKSRVIRFCGDGSGEGVRWEFISPDGNDADSCQ